MRNRAVLKNLLLVLDGFLAVTAIAGGVGLLSGWIAPGLGLLQGSPFSSYLIPGMALLILVGSSALLATVLTYQRRVYGLLASVVAGLMIIGFETVEMVVIGSPAGLARNLQLFYTGLGLLIAALSIMLWVSGQEVDWEQRRKVA